MAAKRGHSKDHRPDLKQLVFILTVTADGAVPVACRTSDGNTEDSTTHIATWNALVELLSRSDFLYVADSKLATRDNMAHIVKNHGRFVSVLPASRKEDAAFRRYLVDHEPTWTEALRRRRRLDDPDDVYETTEAPWPSAEGYRVVWVRSSAKTERDAESRRTRIAAGIFAIDLLNQRLMSPKTRMKTMVAIEHEARQLLEIEGAARWVTFEIEETTEVRHRQETPGAPRRQHPLSQDRDHQAPHSIQRQRGCRSRRRLFGWLLAAHHVRPQPHRQRGPRGLQAPTESRTPSRPVERRSTRRPHVPPRSCPHRRTDEVPLHCAHGPSPHRA